jgi:hypothetical protein
MNSPSKPRTAEDYPRWEGYSLAELRNHACITYREAKGSRPDVLLIEVEGRQAVLKDFSHSDKGFNHLVGPLLVLRETRSLARLDGIPGIPRLLRRINRYAFLIEAVDAIPASQLRDCGCPQTFFVRLHNLLDSIHARGVAHCDLRSAGNTLIDKQQQPWLVDFVASIHQGQPWNLPARWIFRQFTAADHGAVLKLKKRLSPELLTAEENAMLNHRHGWLEGLARNIGKGTRNLTRGLLTGKVQKRK